MLLFTLKCLVSAKWVEKNAKIVYSMERIRVGRESELGCAVGR